MSSKQRKRPGRRLLMFILVIVIGFGALVAGTMRHKASLTPGLALDLEGGTQIILTPTTSDGSAISDNDVEQAIEVIRQRVDASGVSEAQISRQGGQNIVVSLPGKPSQATLELVRTSAVMYFRPVLRILPGSAQQAAKNIASQNPSGEATQAPTDQPTAQAEAQPDPNAAPRDGEPSRPRTPRAARASRQPARKVRKALRLSNPPPPRSPPPSRRPRPELPRRSPRSWRTSTRTVSSPPTRCPPPPRTIPRTPGSPSSSSTTAT